jgi:hypothetical protein
MAHTADAFDEVGGPKNYVDPLSMIEPISHRPADVDHNATSSFLIFGSYGQGVLRT